MNWIELFTLFCNITLIIIAGYATRQIFINQKQLHLSTINNCIKNYRELKGLEKTCNDKIKLQLYLELTNEELFYFQNDYLSLEIAKEWIDGMIDFLPITNSKSEIINEHHCIKYFVDYREEMFRGYPRIKHAFDLESGYVYDVNLLYNSTKEHRKARIAERKKLIAEVLTNIKSFEGFNQNYFFCCNKL